MSKRAEILEYLARGLASANLFDGPVFTSQQKAYALEEMPCALILIARERQELQSESVPRVFKKTAEVSLQVIGEHAPGAEEEMHEVFSDIEFLILGDDTLRDSVSRVIPDSLEFETFMQGNRPIISGTLKFEVIYFESFEPENSQDERLPALELDPRIVPKEGPSDGNVRDSKVS
jgi:hypothetical protein